MKSTVLLRRFSTKLELPSNIISSIKRNHLTVKLEQVPEIKRNFVNIFSSNPSKKDIIATLKSHSESGIFFGYELYVRTGVQATIPAIEYLKNAHLKHNKLYTDELYEFQRISDDYDEEFYLNLRHERELIPKNEISNKYIVNKLESGFCINFNRDMLSNYFNIAQIICHEAYKEAKDNFRVKLRHKLNAPIDFEPGYLYKNTPNFVLQYFRDMPYKLHTLFGSFRILEPAFVKEASEL